MKTTLTSFKEHLDEQYGKTGTSTRKKYEKGFDAFRKKARVKPGKER